MSSSFLGQNQVGIQSSDTSQVAQPGGGLQLVTPGDQIFFQPNFQIFHSVQPSQMIHQPAQYGQPGQMAYGHVQPGQMAQQQVHQGQMVQMPMMMVQPGMQMQMGVQQGRQVNLPKGGVGGWTGCQ